MLELQQPPHFRLKCFKNSLMILPMEVNITDVVFSKQVEIPKKNDIQKLKTLKPAITNNWFSDKVKLPPAGQGPFHSH